MCILCGYVFMLVNEFSSLHHPRSEKSQNTLTPDRLLFASAMERGETDSPFASRHGTCVSRVRSMPQYRPHLFPLFPQAPVALCPAYLIIPTDEIPYDFRHRMPETALCNSPSHSRNERSSPVAAGIPHVDRFRISP